MFLTTWLVSNILLAALIAQLVRHQVYFELPFFSACILFRFVQALALSFALSRSSFLSTAYLITWFITESLAIVLVALASAECYVWLTRRIFRLGQIGAAALVAAAVVGVVVMTGTRLDSAEDLSRSLAYQLRFKQFLMGFMAVSLAFLLAFYRRFPIFAPWQAWPHGMTQLAYLAVHSLGYGTIMAMGMTSTARANDVMSVAWILLLAVWFWIFRNGVTWPPSELDPGEQLKRADEQAKRLERLL